MSNITSAYGLHNSFPPDDVLPGIAVTDVELVDDMLLSHNYSDIYRTDNCEYRCLCLRYFPGCYYNSRSKRVTARPDGGERPRYWSRLVTTGMQSNFHTETTLSVLTPREVRVAQKTHSYGIFVEFSARFH